MKSNIKSRKGFTLIELLVVIGIRAVLAAIAIPSVAGLIDRANVSSDKTNANEMTNAVERFISEYELYCQDIASGAIKSGQTSDFDSAQGRVYNVTQITDRAGIERIEKDSSADANTEGRAIYRDTKYPVNAETMQAIVENYTKTSSSTFEPKQSDMHYWYSPDCGVVVFAEPNADQDKENKLNNQIISGTDAKGNRLDENTKWIDITKDYSAGNGNVNDNTPINHGNIIPEGATYIMANGTVLNAGQAFPESVTVGDKYTYQDYIYNCGSDSGWAVSINTTTTSKNKETYSQILSTINNKAIVSVKDLFLECHFLKNSPTIPSTVTNMDGTFADCGALKNAPIIPQSVTTMQGTFEQCTSLKVAPIIPSGVTNMRATFNYCTSLKQAPELPAMVNNLQDTFAYCTSLKKAPTIPSATMLTRTFKGCSSLIETPSFGDGVMFLLWTFQDCTSLKTIPSLPRTLINMQETFSGCTSLVDIPQIPATVSSISFAFAGCTSLTDLSGLVLPNNTGLYGAFANCTSLTNAPVIPSGVTNFSQTFKGCSSLSNTITINTNTTNISNCFQGVDFDRQNITLNGTSTSIDSIGATGMNYCSTCNGVCKNNH